MALQHIRNVRIRGLSACVPSQSEENRGLGLFPTQEDAEKFIETTGIASRRVVSSSGICTSDLCCRAAERLIMELGWDRDEISCLIFVSQTPDYILPATACILQNRLKLPIECFAMDISLGCSGWIYGLSTISALISSGGFKKALLLAGDTTTVTKSRRDKSTYPLFGDAGTATALEYHSEDEGLKFHTSTDGSGYDSIIIPEGGFRNFFKEASLIEREVEPGIIRNGLQSSLNGASVFTFGITKAPRSINALLDHFGVKKSEVDYFVLHQANRFMNEKIRSKLKIEESKVPYSLSTYGNTSSASIPLTIVSELRSEVSSRAVTLIGCGFGVGLSWGSALFSLDRVVCPEVVEY